AGQLELQLHRQLDHPVRERGGGGPEVRGVPRVRDLPEGRVAHLEDGQREVRRVGEVEGLHAELDAHVVLDRDELDDAHVQVHVGGAPDDVAARVAGQEGPAVRRQVGHEGGGVEPVVDTPLRAGEVGVVEQ